MLTTLSLQFTPMNEDVVLDRAAAQPHFRVWSGGRPVETFAAADYRTARAYTTAKYHFAAHVEQL